MFVIIHILNMFHLLVLSFCIWISLQNQIEYFGKPCFWHHWSTWAEESTISHCMTGMTYVDWIPWIFIKLQDYISDFRSKTAVGPDTLTPDPWSSFIRLSILLAKLSNLSIMTFVCSDRLFYSCFTKLLQPPKRNK